MKREACLGFGFAVTGPHEEESTPSSSSRDGIRTACHRPSRPTTAPSTPFIANRSVAATAPAGPHEEESTPASHGEVRLPAHPPLHARLLIQRTESPADAYHQHATCTLLPSVHSSRRYDRSARSSTGKREGRWTSIDDTPLPVDLTKGDQSCRRSYHAASPSSLTSFPSFPGQG